MLWCRYLKSRTAIVASNFWASKYFGADSFSKFGIWGFWDLSCKNSVPQVVVWCSSRIFCHCLSQGWTLLSLLDLLLGSVFFTVYVIVCLWLYHRCFLSQFYMVCPTPQTVQDHKTCPSTNSRATICQCQWDATIHGYLGSLIAEQLLPIKKIWNIKWKWTNNWKFGVIMWSNQKCCRGGYFDKNMDKPSCKR